jgi:predicted amidophosphoribosyltransferase
LLERTRPTLTQTRLSREQRAKNVQKAFARKNSTRLAGQKIVLLDDVFTTGATTSACARILREGGAAEVCVWSLARGL